MPKLGHIRVGVGANCGESRKSPSGFGNFSERVRLKFEFIA